MTDAEKAAAAKAEAEKKAADKNKDGSNDGEGTEEGDPEDDEPEYDAATAKARIEKLNLESKKHRLARKEAEAKLKEIQDLKDAGDKEKAVHKEVKKEFDAKLRNAFLKTAVFAAAKDSHDPAAVFELASKKLKDVTVDLDAEEVDAEELQEVMDEMRESKPYLFKKADAEGEGEPDLTAKGKEKKARGKLPPDQGRPTGGANFYQTWQQLLQQNRMGEAQEFYAKNRGAIFAQMKANPNLG